MAAQPDIAHHEIDDLERRIRQKREEFLARGATGEELDRDMEGLLLHHSRIRDALSDPLSPARETLDAEIAVLRSAFERWVEQTDARFGPF